MLPQDSWDDSATLLEPELPGRSWRRISPILLAAWLIFFTVFLFQLARGRGFLLLVDTVLIPIHEGGHLLFGYLGQAIGIAGGTFLQLFVPFALALYFVRYRQAQGVAFCLFFFFEQFLPVATYMADARAQELPLLTVGDSEYVIHDWNYLFARTGLLEHDIQIANAVRFVGWIGMISVTLWLLWRGINDFLQKQPLEDETSPK